MNNSAYVKIAECRICGNTELDKFVDIGDQALSGRFPGPDEIDPPVAPLVVVRCTNCHLVQLLHTVIAGELFTYGYGYRSGTNETMRSHLAEISAWVSQICHLNSGDTVVDIGCNDGTLLKSYNVPGLIRIGVDAIAGKFKEFYPPDIKAIEGFFTSELSSQSIGRGKAKAITSIAMFYDLENPGEFVEAIAETLANDGVWVLEQSYLGTMLETNAFDTICHEHLEYYGLDQIDRLTEEHGLRVFHVEKNNINGGSFRLAVCHKDADFEATKMGKEFRTSEKTLGLKSTATYEAFIERVDKIRDELVAFVEGEHAAGKKIYVYGASTKGNTLLQYCGLDNHYITAAADRNPEKWGHRTPLTSIPIISEEEARADSPDYFIVLPWHFRDEFLEREAAFRANGGKFIFPLPNFEIV